MSLSSKDSFGPSDAPLARRALGHAMSSSMSSSTRAASPQEQRHMRSESLANPGSGHGTPSRQSMRAAAASPIKSLPQSPLSGSRKNSMQNEHAQQGMSQLTPSMSNLALEGNSSTPMATTPTTATMSSPLDERRVMHLEAERATQSSPSTSKDHTSQSSATHSTSAHKAGPQAAHNEPSLNAPTSAATTTTRREGKPSKSSRDREAQRRPHKVREASTAQHGETSSGHGSRPGPHESSSRTGTLRSTRAYHVRTVPHLPSAPNVKPAPPPAMYWSKAPVHGTLPRRSFRAHTACLSDEILWLFGGCDAKGCFRDLWCFDTETMCWSKPKVSGDSPPPRRAHTATMVDKRLFVFAGGDGPYYFNDLYVFDTVALRWSRPNVLGQPPSPRRAHTSNYYNGNLIIFGGGNGVGALNDVHTLDITDIQRLEWRRLECQGKTPVGRGYHTSNLVDGKLIVIGGSDGHKSFNDIHILKLDTQVWYQVQTEETHCRLGHTATQVGSYLFVVGGHDSQKYTPEILTLNLVNLQWEPRKVCGAAPAGRGYHQAWLRDSRLFVHGGFDGKEIFDDLYYVDLAAHAYLPQITSFSVELEDE